MVGDAGNCCDQWMDGTDACVDGFCQHGSRVKGLLKESYLASRQTLKDLHNPPPPEFCVTHPGPGQCGAGQCGAGQCGAGRCHECEQFGPMEAPAGCGTGWKPKWRRPQFDAWGWRPNWRPSWKFPWKKSRECMTCGSAGGCGCGAGSHEYPAGYASTGNDGFNSPDPNQIAAGPGMASPEEYFLPSTANGGGQFGGVEQYGVQQAVPQVNSPQFNAPQFNAPQFSTSVSDQGMPAAQPLPEPLPEGSPRGLQWRAVSTYRENFPAPPAAEKNESAPYQTPSRVLNGGSEGADEFVPPLIIESK